MTIRTYRFIRVGKIVFVDVYFDTTAQIANNARILTFTKALPKPINKYAIGACRSVSGNFALVSIEDNNPNYVAAWGPIPAGTYYYAQMVYVTRE